MADFDYEPDEKHKTVAVSEQGVEKAEKFLGIENMYLAEHGNLVNHLIQSLKAESLYKRDVDYSVIDGEVKIIDEFTGRILEGRRWSEGLHQAVEAKEGVAIQEENQTVATITYQNYFRRYDKLGGMTGTALTEATEFMKIYELQVVEIPTNRPMVREDKNDQIYKTKDGKWAAVVNEIADRHHKGQPVLVGTISVEVSELLSEQLKRKGIPHTVLNAKPEHAEREGEIIAEAGMSRRGHHRDEHGRPRGRHQARRQRGAPDPPGAGGPRPRVRHTRVRGGLGPAVPAPREEVGSPIASSSWSWAASTSWAPAPQARRIDNQLRGRSGRQGDPGESRFYLSAEDDLVRLFAGERIYKILDRLGPIDKEGNEQQIKARDPLKKADRERSEEGRGAELPHPQARPRIRRRDEPASAEVVYEIRDRILPRARHLGRPRAGRSTP